MSCWHIPSFLMKEALSGGVCFLYVTIWGHFSCFKECELDMFLFMTSVDFLRLKSRCPLQVLSLFPYSLIRVYYDHVFINNFPWLCYWRFLDHIHNRNAVKIIFSSFRSTRKMLSCSCFGQILLQFQSNFYSLWQPCTSKLRSNPWGGN